MPACRVRRRQPTGATYTGRVSSRHTTGVERAPPHGPVLSHGGANIGMHSNLYVIPEQKAVLAVLTNSTTGFQLYTALCESLLKECFDVRSPAPSYPPEPRVDIDHDRFVGVYRSPNGEVSIEVHGGRLHLRTTPSPELLAWERLMGGTSGGGHRSRSSASTASGTGSPWTSAVPGRTGPCSSTTPARPRRRPPALRSSSPPAQPPGRPSQRGGGDGDDALPRWSTTPGRLRRGPGVGISSRGAVRALPRPPGRHPPCPDTAWQW